jgi:hypothetical protein
VDDARSATKQFLIAPMPYVSGADKPEVRVNLWLLLAAQS